MTKNKWFINLTGWIGATTSLTAYSLNSHHLLQSSSFIYLLMNVVGCTLLIFYTYNKGAFANAVLNSIWLVVTLLAIGSLIIS